MPDLLATRSARRLVPEPSRVVTQLFVPGHALAGERDGRASHVVAHVLELPDAAIEATLATIVARFGGRHRDLHATFLSHADRLANRVAPGFELSEDRRLLLGATFTHEYSVEAAALCNPSAVPAPDQSGLRPGELRFVMSVRQIGEGHRSSIGFRTGVVDAAGAVTVDDAGPFTTAGTVEEGVLDADTFRYGAGHDDGESVEWVLAPLGERFSLGQLDVRIRELTAQHDTRRHVPETVRRLRDLASRTYAVRFPAASALGEHVLVPSTAAESNGVEDARFVRFVEPDGAVTYYATYTTYDGRAIAQQLLATTDFVTFTSSPLVGAAAANKGLALFPRRIGGALFALSRHDGETNAVACTDDIHRWPASAPLAVDATPWEALQVGNCGPPIELDEGWLVLTHGVGPMRTYSIGALLLDLDDPTVVIGRARSPLLTPQDDEQDGYVPNVVYSCGALRHDDLLLVPYGIADANIGFASFAIDAVLDAIDDHPGTEGRILV